MRLETSRLLLRPWEDRDRAGFAAINADPEVCRYYYPSVLPPAETDALIDEARPGWRQTASASSRSSARRMAR